MSQESRSLSERLAAMRAEFDGAFAAPHVERETLDEQILIVSVGGISMGVRLRDVSGVVARRKVVRLPPGPKGLHGIAGLKGDAVPVYLLASLLDVGGDDGTWRWLLVVGENEPLALAFAGIEACVAISASAVTPLESPGPFVASLVRISDRSLPLIAIRALANSIRLNAGRALIAERSRESRDE